jgi:hypothetical protein
MSLGRCTNRVFEPKSDVQDLGVITVRIFHGESRDIGDRESQVEWHSCGRSHLLERRSLEMFRRRKSYTKIEVRRSDYSVEDPMPQLA